MVESHESVPFRAINYLIGSCNYGGRITDPWDERIVECLLSNILNSEMLGNNAPLLRSTVYHVLNNESNIFDYVTYIETLPTLDTPEIFGLHENARITCARNETTLLLSNLLSITPRTSSAREDTKAEIFDISDRILSYIGTGGFNMSEVRAKFPIEYKASMHTVLLSELEKFNNLTRRIQETLAALKASLEGIQVITPDLEALADNLLRA